MIDEQATQLAFPSHIDMLLEIGLESRNEDDRVLALRAANHFDNEHATNYGTQVIEGFVEQCGLSFEPSVNPDATWVHTAETPQTAVASQEIIKAVGSLIGVECTVYELLSARAKIAAITVVQSIPEVFIRDFNMPGISTACPFNLPNLLGMTGYNKPLSMSYFYSEDKSGRNLRTARHALTSNGGPKHRL